MSSCSVQPRVNLRGVDQLGVQSYTQSKCKASDATLMRRWEVWMLSWRVITEGNTYQRHLPRQSFSSAFLGKSER
jgi:hypothetical protein